jgi:hypothetical protein
MSISSPCEICTTGTVEHTCSRCGNLVCDEHYDETTGLCVECVSDVSGGTTDEENRPDGVDTYRF